ncbi:hypothetical protein K474DRAFT_1683617 [Panus rudis PR-1116 ss-1]|nr:hypothetical protein K474DRAFT_1683617 [Panus rudis PR-1116 ss-1]
MNNDPNGNYIITAELASDGKLSYKGAFSTHGKGLHGLPLGGGDGLFSQSSVVVSRSKHLLATVNPGSNTIALFRINPMNPVELQLVSQPANSGGEFPVSVAFDSKGETLCAINSGKINGVNCYHVDDWTGLKPIPNTQRLFGLNQTTPATGPANTPSEIIFSEDGSQLIASVKGSSVDQPRFLAIWDINKDGSLSQQFKSVPAGRGGIRPFGFSTISGKNAFVVADPAIGCEIFDTSGSQATAPTSTAVNVTSQMAICWTAYSHSTGSFYLIDAGNADVVEINVDDYPNIYLYTYALPQGSGTLDSQIATIRNGKTSKDYLYLLGAAKTSVDVLSLDGPGKATVVGAFDVKPIADTHGLAIDPNNLQGMATYTL